MSSPVYTVSFTLSNDLTVLHINRWNAHSLVFGKRFFDRFFQRFFCH